MKRFTISAVKKDGNRMLAFDNNHLNTFETFGEAEDKLNNILKNTNPDVIEDLIGKDLRIDEIECYPTGDAKGIYIL